MNKPNFCELWKYNEIPLPPHANMNRLLARTSHQKNFYSSSAVATLMAKRERLSSSILQRDIVHREMKKYSIQMNRIFHVKFFALFSFFSQWKCRLTVIRNRNHQTLTLRLCSKNTEAVAFLCSKYIIISFFARDTKTGSSRSDKRSDRSNTVIIPGTFR